MNFKIGRLNLPSEQYFNELVQKGILRPWDASPRLREEHDKEVGNKYNTTNALSSKERGLLWLKYLKEKKGERELTSKEKVANSWI